MVFQCVPYDGLGKLSKFWVRLIPYHTQQQHALERRVLYITYINPPEMSCRLDFLPVPCKWGWSPSPGTCSSRGDKNKTIILCYSRVNNTQKIISDRKCWDYSNVCCAFDVVCCVFGREDFVFMRGALVVMKTMRTGDAHLSWHKHTHISNTAFNCWTTERGLCTNDDGQHPNVNIYMLCTEIVLTTGLGIGVDNREHTRIVIYCIGTGRVHAIASASCWQHYWLSTEPNMRLYCYARFSYPSNWDVLRKSIITFSDRFDLSFISCQSNALHGYCGWLCEAI